MTKERPWRRVGRIEPDPRNISPVSGAQVPLGDPLWLLGRQWWVGEMDFFDGGTPLQADVQVGAEPLSSVRALGLASPDLIPSAALSTWANFHWRDRLRLGHSLLAHAERHAKADTLAQALLHQVTLQDNHPILNRMEENRRIDGLAVINLWSSDDLDLPADLLDLVREWAVLQMDSNDSFDHDHRRHATTLTGKNGANLQAEAATGPQLRWFDFTGSAGDAPLTVFKKPLSRLSVPGAQPDRWWRFEDTQLDWTAVPAGPSDLGQLLIAASFAEQGQLMWRCDIETPTNTLVTIGTVRVTDTFGRITTVENGQSDALRGWCDNNGAMPLLATAPLMQGAPFEQAIFRTDPTDNLAWLEETTVRDSAGRGTEWRPRPKFDESDEPVLAIRKAPPENFLPFAVDGDALQHLPLQEGRQPGEGHTYFAKARFTLRSSQIGARGFAYALCPMLGRAPSGRRLAWLVAYARPAPRPGSSSGLAHDVIMRPAL
ncbi:hypothetical protein [Granulosicoccus antarcticus]|uniref:Uncharacterized protein n=1 Tax=Granulosicoccus antarcticus IMCC3135 TaxID=1192854 RepID=A0A2Z2NWJ8_9GAMM|nr:hypothetical protein [Granulosicoccus antarcticus]ASJ72087.1 hypothetical protein IMCC3135_09965 [Granulosicoccus antarcticus IMCC3135]